MTAAILDGQSLAQVSSRICNNVLVINKVCLCHHFDTFIYIELGIKLATVGVNEGNRSPETIKPLLT